MYICLGKLGVCTVLLGSNILSICMFPVWLYVWYHACVLYLSYMVRHIYTVWLDTLFVLHGRTIMLTCMYPVWLYIQVCNLSYMLGQLC